MSARPGRSIVCLRGLREQQTSVHYSRKNCRFALCFRSGLLDFTCWRNNGNRLDTINQVGNRVVPVASFILPSYPLPTSAIVRGFKSVESIAALYVFRPELIPFVIFLFFSIETNGKRSNKCENARRMGDLRRYSSSDSVIEKARYKRGGGTWKADLKDRFSR